MAPAQKQHLRRTQARCARADVARAGARRADPDRVAVHRHLRGHQHRRISRRARGGERPARSDAWRLHPQADSRNHVVRGHRAGDGDSDAELDDAVYAAAPAAHPSASAAHRGGRRFTRRSVAGRVCRGAGVVCDGPAVRRPAGRGGGGDGGGRSERRRPRLRGVAGGLPCVVAHEEPPARRAVHAVLRAGGFAGVVRADVRLPLRW